jgi:hypothetical protein
MFANLDQELNFGFELLPVKSYQIILNIMSCFQLQLLYCKANWQDDVKGLNLGRAIAQAVSHWFPTAAARVRARVWSCAICGGQSGAGVGFLRVLRFPLPVFIPPIAPQSPSSVIWGWYIRSVEAAVPSGLSLTPLIKIIIIIKN